MPQWTADIAVTLPLAAHLVSEQFPQFACATFEPFGCGWDNAAFLVAGRVVFRFPRRRVAAGSIAREIAVLPKIAAHLPLAIPVPRFLGAESSAYPWRFAGYELIAGVSSCSLALTDDDRIDLARPLGAFLKALHSIEPAPLVEVGLPPDQMGRLDHAQRLQATHERLSALVPFGELEDGERFAAWLEALPPVALNDAERRLVHGDLYARHVLVDGSVRLTGIIDWGDVHLGDSALDIALAHLVLPSRAHAAFRAAYGTIDGRTWSVARYRAIYHAILQLDYGVREADAGMRQSGLSALRFIRESM